MNCKYCGAELDDGVMECPACGKAQTDEEIATAETDEEAVAAEQTAAEAGAAGLPDQSMPSQKSLDTT